MTDTAARTSKKSSPIRATLFGLVAIPLLALVLAITYDTYQRYRSGTEEAYRTARNILTLSITQTEQYLDNTRYVLAELSARPRILSLDANDCDPFLAELKQLQPSYANILTLDANGYLICSVTKSTAAKNTGPDPAFYFNEVARTQQFTVGKPTKGFVTGRWVSTLAYPLKAQDGKFLGVVAISVDLVNYQPLVSRLSLPSGTTIGITNSDRIVISRSRKAAERVGTLSDAESVHAMVIERQGAIRSRNYMGDERLYVFGPIAWSDWIAFVSVDESSFVKPIVLMAYRRLGLIVVLFLLVVMITILLARRISRPVEAISRTMASVGSGATNERAEVEGPEELRKIATELNQMLDLRIQAEADLRQSEERFRGLFEETRQATMLIENGHFVAANLACLQMLHLEHLEQFLGCTPADISPLHQRDGRLSSEKLAEVLERTLANGSFEVEWLHVRADGEPFDVRVLLTLLHQQGKEMIHVVWMDITEQKRAIERIRYLAFNDELTGLPNRVSALEQLQQAIATAHSNQSSIGILQIDLNKLKYVNETHSHAIGDLLLKGVALRLAECLHAGEALSRLLGDEFMVLVSNVSSSQHLKAVCERILAHLAASYDIEGIQLVSTFSIGVCIYPQDGAQTETLLRHADIALSAAKKTGSNSYCFFEYKMNAAVMHYVEIRDALRLAVERNEFTLHYQPQVELLSGRVVGAEALVRWNRPGHGLVMPAAFISVAEESGLIEPIGRWVLREACRQTAIWCDAGWKQFVVAVNVSAVQFRQGRVEQDVYEALHHNGLHAENLELELTESILLQDDATVIDTLARWRERGIRLSIDDFGTGYSSLSYLKKLTVDKLKIDQSFSANLAHDDQDRVVVQAIIQVARAMKLKTIAEGVETQEVLTQLEALGCDEAQGYLFSKPLPVEQFERWLSSRHHETY